MHLVAFTGLHNQLRRAIRLAHHNTEEIVCIHTDASVLHWAVCPRQFTSSDLDEVVTDQAHEPLAFISGTFCERESHWSTYEREAYAVVQGCRKLDYLLT